MKIEQVKNFPLDAESITYGHLNRKQSSSDPGHLESLAMNSIVGAYQVNQTQTKAFWVTGTAKELGK